MRYERYAVICPKHPSLGDVTQMVDYFSTCECKAGIAGSPTDLGVVVTYETQTAETIS